MTESDFDAPPARYWMLLCCVSTVLCLPVLWTRYAPLVDYPNHLARAYILYHYDHTPAYRQNYVIKWGPLPNLAVDLVVPFLLRFFRLINASRIFLATTVLLFLLGCHLLGKAIHGRPTWLALPCAFFVYNSMFLYGFVNYVFGLGLMCISLALWLRWRHNWNPLRLMVVVALVLCAYLAHLTAYGFIGVSFAVTTLWSYVKEDEPLGSALLSISPLLLPLILFLAFVRENHEAGPVIWNDLQGKLVGTLSLLVSYDRAFDLGFLVLVAAILVLLAFRTERVRVVWPLFTTGMVFVLFFLVSPKVLMSSFAADARFIPAAGLILVLSLDLKVPRANAKAVLLTFLAISSIRVSLIWRTWASLDRRIAAEIEMFRVFPEGARIYPVFPSPEESTLDKAERAFEHTILYATVNHNAFVPTLFAIKGQQPLRFREYPAYRTPTIRPDSRQWVDLLAGYDFVWSYVLPQSVQQILESRCTAILKGEGVTIWRVNKYVQTPHAARLPTR